MINENSLCLELINRGYRPFMQDVIKNGVKLRGLTIKKNNENIAPCIYINEILNDFDSLTEAADKIIDIYNSHQTIDLGCDIQDISEPEFIQSHTYIGLQKDSEEDIIRRSSPYEGIEEFLYIRGKSENGRIWSTKLKPVMTANMDIEDLWQIAEKRTFREFQIFSLADILKNTEFDYNGDISDMEPSMYIITNSEKYRGAALACDMQSIKAWAEEHNYAKAMILPSSVHEMILVPIKDEDMETCSLEIYNYMVKEINETQVDPTERLTDRAYILNLRDVA